MTSPADPSPSLRAADVSRKIAPALQAVGLRKSAAYGWTVRQYAPGAVDVTLNFFGDGDDAKALDIIRETLGDAYGVEYIPALSDYEHLPDDLYRCAIVSITRVPAKERSSMDEQSVVTVKVPGALDHEYSTVHENDGDTLDAADRALYEAWGRRRTSPAGKVVTVAVPSEILPQFALHFSELADFHLSDKESEADPALGEEALKVLSALAEQGIKPAGVSGYRMPNADDQARLDADIAHADEKRQQQQERKAAQDARAASWDALGREEQQRAELELLDRAAKTLGVQRPEGRRWLQIDGRTVARVGRGRLNIEASSLRDEVTAVHQARAALAAAGWVDYADDDRYVSALPPERSEEPPAQ
ncbi:hypothetical protein [Streptomyces sp. NPDC059009]|uniref:hypothetical protein n=1 Tax=Streptomyces sp. NPDC059009 TaxID=3346694 RepID=UPI0036954196